MYSFSREKEYQKKRYFPRRAAVPKNALRSWETVKGCEMFGESVYTPANGTPVPSVDGTAEPLADFVGCI